MSDSLRPNESQQARTLCPSPTPGVHSDSCPSSQWCHPAISSSVVSFSSCAQSLPASESFPMSQLFAWGDQSTGISALASFLPKKFQGWSPSEWTKVHLVKVLPISISYCHLFGEGNGKPLQYSCLENPMDGGAWWAAVHGVATSRTRLSDFTFTQWRRQWQPTPVFLPGESQGRQSLVGCCLWGRTELDTTEAT